MAYLIGTDEAGYGPNLGPLVVSATVWQVESIAHTELFSALRGAVRRCNDDKTATDEIVIGDSKDLYKPGKGLSGLEQGVFSCLAAVGKQPRSWKTMFRTLAVSDFEALTQLPWYHDCDLRLPLEMSSQDVSARAKRLVEHCDAAGCIPQDVISRVVAPRQFNALIDELGNKAFALSHTTLQLVRHALSSLPDDEPVYVLCDKHGGRNRYGPLLNESFPESLAVVRKESREESVYQLGTGKRRREIVFRAKADESFLPSALASMVSKYLRELAMRAFNEYWTHHVDDLKPTAGYPVDAKRFKQQIEPTQKRLGIDDRVLWRCR